MAAVFLVVVVVVTVFVTVDNSLCRVCVLSATMKEKGLRERQQREMRGRGESEEDEEEEEKESSRRWMVGGEKGGRKEGRKGVFIICGDDAVRLSGEREGGSKE